MRPIPAVRGWEDFQYTPGSNTTLKHRTEMRKMKVKTTVKVGQNAISCDDVCQLIAGRLGLPSPWPGCLDACGEWCQDRPDELDAIEFCMDLSEGGADPFAMGETCAQACLGQLF
jgi:hypothetical protein